jgi:UDP-N-acetylenolpyruvoylglucosamine reductase
LRAGDQPTVWCEAGVIIANLAKRCASKGLAGLEWSATVPGTVGGAVYGNAGAFGGDRIGNAEVSPLHGNFFVNHGATRAEDIRKLVQLVQKTVKEKQGVELELEIEMVGEWQI